MRQWIAAVLFTAVSGCGTITTLTDEEGAADNLAKWKSGCSSIPRAYSGVAYQFCNLDAPARSGSHWAAPPILLDMAVSGVADTILIPYTGYLQYQQGDIKIRREQY